MSNSVLYLESYSLESSNTLRAGSHIREAVSLLDLLLNESVVLVVLVILGSQAPLIGGEELQNTREMSSGKC